jgi:hypothetical protein
MECGIILFLYLGYWCAVAILHLFIVKPEYGRVFISGSD